MTIITVEFFLYKNYDFMETLTTYV